MGLRLSKKELEELITMGEKLLGEKKKDEARAIFIKAVRIAEDLAEEATGLERYKLKSLINKLNTIIKEIDER